MTAKLKFAAIVLLLGVAVLNAQTQTSAPATDKTLAFDVASIRRNVSGFSTLDTQNIGSTANGYQMTNMSLVVPLLTAYTPTTGQVFYHASDVKGLPDWVNSEWYNIEARIDPALMADWAMSEKLRAMLPVLLGNLLAERCKLAVHRERQEVSSSSLIVGKNGPKFSESKPGEAHPKGKALAWGGEMAPEIKGQSFIVHFYDVPIGYLVGLFEQWTGSAVVDKTGLKGRYDFDVELGVGMADADNGGFRAHANDVASKLGLKLISEKNIVEVLVIDHMERPSEN